MRIQMVSSPSHSFLDLRGISNSLRCPKAEDYHANEYPDEDLEFEDEFDDTNAAYSKYRRYASDDEQFDVDDENEYGIKSFSYGGSAGGLSDDDNDDDEKMSLGY